MGKIIIAIDGSKMTERVLVKGRAIAENFNYDVIILTVVKKLQMINYYTGADLNERVNDEFEASARRTMEQAETFFAGFSGNVETRIAQGDPAEEILKTTEDEQPDLLVMGSRGLSGFERVMLGSVSLKVLHHVACDMMIVRNE